MDSGPCYLSHILLLILSVGFLQVAEYLTKKEWYFTLINPYFLNEKLLENVIVTHSLKYHHNLLLMQIYEILDVNNHMSVISQKMSHYGLKRSKFGFLQPVPLAAKAFRLLLMFESPSSFRNAWKISLFLSAIWVQAVFCFMQRTKLNQNLIHVAFISDRSGALSHWEGILVQLSVSKLSSIACHKGGFNFGSVVVFTTFLFLLSGPSPAPVMWGCPSVSSVWSFADCPGKVPALATCFPLHLLVWAVPKTTCELCELQGRMWR